MDILLGHRLRNQQGVGLEFDRFGDELFVGHLAAHVEGFEHLVALQSVVACEAFHVHNGVDTYRMGVRAGAGADHHDRAADLLADEAVRFGHVPFGRFDFRDMDIRIIDRMGAASVAVEERVTGRQLPVEYYLRVLEAHLFHQLFGRFDGFVAGGHGQCETQLRFAVVHCVAVGLYLFQVEGLVEIPAFG